jgi:hypothetical protein
MNKLTKIGVSALCGSLATVSAANAGSLEVLGGAAATYSSHEGQVTGNPIGLSTGITMTGSGELDNGTTFTLTLTQADQVAYSAGSIAIVTPSMGGIKINGKAGGTGIDRYDDMMPTAWEETNGTSLGTGLVTVAGVGTQMNVEWTAPADMLPDGMSLGIALAPAASGATTNDKGVGGDSGGVGQGFDIAVGHTGLLDGLNVFGGISTIDQANASTDKTTDDRSQWVAGATYATGSFTIGYQQSMDEFNATSGSGTQYYENAAYGISFQVNDDLTLSYGSHQSERGLVHNGTTAPIEVEAESLQLSYTMGGMSINFAESSVDNASYTAGTSADWDGRTIRLSLAF